MGRTMVVGAVAVDINGFSQTGSTTFLFQKITEQDHFGSVIYHSAVGAGSGPEFQNF
jgi:hypothetical protein